MVATISLRKRVWGWFFFDWASQPYNTLLITFIFGPYVKELLDDGAGAQAAWGYGITAAGLAIAVLAPVLGALADISGNRIRWIWLFSAMYVIGAGMLWFAAPDDFNLLFTLMFFAIGLVGMEMATIFTNSMLPDLGPREDIGKLSGNGWAFGYVGGLLALVIMLTLFAESAETGRTILGIEPILGFDPMQREGTRFVGPLTALWYALFMVPFFLFVREPRRMARPAGAFGKAMRQLGSTIRNLPHTPSLFAYLGSSMLYRDALNGMYAFGGIYAAGVLGWGVVDTGMFGIIAIIAGAIFAWIGGRADAVFGPKPVITTCIIVLTFVAIAITLVSRETLFGIAVAEGSRLPDITFLTLGAIIGAAGGVIQSASRTMMVRQARPGHMAEGFGLFALAGKATSFIAPASVAVATQLTGSQQLGVTPLIALFLLGLFLLFYVKSDGDRAA
ncbi:MFS transporter [Primorskyibacter flagellatus]|uniref:MFS transporter n=1 Tax=Primorskyibacter flagellatus TaxID=1387277 RepID=UPI003A8DDE64